MDALFDHDSADDMLGRCEARRRRALRASLIIDGVAVPYHRFHEVSDG